MLEETLTEHATVIPRLAIGVLEVRGLMKPEETDKFMTALLRSVRSCSSTTACTIPDSHSAYRDESLPNNTSP